MRIGGLLILCGLLAAGLVRIDDPIPPTGTAGAPHRTLTQAEQARFLRGRLLFDKDFMRAEGIGPQFNGDSCRACHHDPVIGGAGGIDLQVQRPAGSPPQTGDLAHTHCLFDKPREEIPSNVLFVEERNSPTILGLGLVETISDATILAGEDPDDLDGDGIRGVAHILGGGEIGRFGWKLQVPSLRAFLRDAMGNEMGITVPNSGNTFGFIADADGVPDPELGTADLEDLLFFMQTMDFAPKRGASTQTLQGEQLFNTIGCAKCHTPAMDGVELYSDLLLHDVLGPGFTGVTQGQATSGLYRTPPLRGARDTAPYFHDGRAEDLDSAIRRHTGEAEAVKALFTGLSAADRAALIAFLNSL